MTDEAERAAEHDRRNRVQLALTVNELLQSLGFEQLSPETQARIRQLAVELVEFQG